MFQQTVYSVAESGGVVEVCVNLSGNLERNVTITLSTSDGSAVGKLSLLLYCKFHSMSPCQYINTSLALLQTVCIADMLTLVSSSERHASNVCFCYEHKLMITHHESTFYTVFFAHISIIRLQRQFYWHNFLSGIQHHNVCQYLSDSGWSCRYAGPRQWWRSGADRH